MSSQNLITGRLSGINDGDVKVGWINFVGDDISGDLGLTIGQELIGAVKLGPRTLHPFSIGVSREFLVLFKVDDRIRLAVEASGALNEDEKLQQIEALTRIAVFKKAWNGSLVNRNLVNVNVQSSNSRSIVSNKPEIVQKAGSDIPVLMDIFCDYQLCLGNMVAVGNKETARRILAKFVLNGNVGLPLLVVTTGSEYVGKTVGQKEYTILTGKTVETNEDKFPTIDDLSRNFRTLGSNVESMKARACYELLGSLSDSENSLFCLMTEWKSSKSIPIARLLASPSVVPDKAYLLVRIASTMDTNIEKRHAFRDQAFERHVRALRTIILEANDEDRAYAMNEAAWKLKVESFIFKTSEGSPFSREEGKGNSKDLSIKDTPEKQSKFKVTNRNRTNLDFVEQFWNEILSNASSIRMMFEALKMLVRALTTGELLPYVHKSNTTYLARLCRQAIQLHVNGKKENNLLNEEDDDDDSIAGIYGRQFSLAQPQSSTWQKMKRNLIELGMYRVDCELSTWLLEFGLDSSLVENVFQEAKSLNDNERLSKVNRLKRSCDLGWSAIAFRCPHDHVRTLVMASLEFYADLNIQNDTENPAFLISMENSQLPWVQSEVEGISGLPMPAYWQLEQRDYQDRNFQVCRLATDNCEMGARNQSLSDEVATKLLKMYRAREAEEAIHAVIAQEYQKQDNPHLKCTTLQLRTVKVP